MLLLYYRLYFVPILKRVFLNELHIINLALLVVDDCQLVQLVCNWCAACVLLLSWNSANCSWFLKRVFEEGSWCVQLFCAASVQLVFCSWCVQLMFPPNVLLLCASTVCSWCVQLVCAACVCSWCVQLVCAAGVCSWCVQLVCAAGVWSWYVQLVCAAGVCSWCVKLVCAAFVCSWCVQLVFRYSRAGRHNPTAGTPGAEAAVFVCSVCLLHLFIYVGTYCFLRQ